MTDQNAEGRDIVERAREFVSGAFGPFNLPSLEPYVVIVAALLENERKIALRHQPQPVAAPARSAGEPIAMLSGIHGVALVRHIKAMLPKAQERYHTPLYAALAPPADEAAIRADERERCAEYIDQKASEWFGVYMAELLDLATTIRALPPKPAPLVKQETR